MIFEWDKSFCAYINLKHRIDRRAHMQRELKRVGLKAVRAVALKTADNIWPKKKVAVKLKRSPGAIGCMYSQVAVMKEAHKRGKHAIIFEDDLVFASDIQKRIPLIEDFCNNNDWDVMFLGCCFHVPTQWHKSVNGKHTHPDMRLCNCTINADAVKTNYPYIIRAYGVWSTHSYIVNYNSIEKILKLFDENVHLSMGIDWLFMYLSPQLKEFAFVPGCVKQYDNQSDIGNGITRFSNFRGLGAHWFADDMRKFDYSKFKV